MRGRARQSLHQHLQHALDVRQYVIVPETQHAVARGLEIARACVVAVLLAEMLATPNSTKPPLGPDEIDDVAADLMPMAELAAIRLPVPQAVPERLPGIRHARAQFTRPIHVHAFHP
jgi:hypothetical protein